MVVASQKQNGLEMRYMVLESVVLITGRLVPGGGHVKQRGENVAIVLLAEPIECLELKTGHSYFGEWT